MNDTSHISSRSVQPSTGTDGVPLVSAFAANVIHKVIARLCLAITICAALSSLPTLANNYANLSWSNLNIVRAPQSNELTVTATLTNGGGAAITNAQIVLVASSPVNSGIVDNQVVFSPFDGASGIASSASLSISATVPSAFPQGAKLFVCARDTTGFGQPRCPAPGQTGGDPPNASSSPELTAPGTSNVFWAARAQVKTGDSATPTNANLIDLSALAFNAVTSSAWLFGCEQLQSGGGSPPPCRVTFTFADSTTRVLPIDPPVGTPFPLYFKGADNRGNLRICAGYPWNAPTSCKSVWQDGMVFALNSISVTIGTTSTNVTVNRNIPAPPPPAPILTVTSPALALVQSAGTLPIITFPVSRQNPSLMPTGSLTCLLSNASVLPYTCAPSGDIINTTSASCVCSPSPATAPTVTAPTQYSMSLTAAVPNATPSTLSTAQATITVQPASGNRGCTDDLTVPVIDEIDSATRSQFYPRTRYTFSTAGDGVVDPPPVAAIKLIIPAGGGLWARGNLEIGPGSGTASHEGVISRCRGRFGAAGREHVMYLFGYTGSENQTGSTFFTQWAVSPLVSTTIYEAKSLVGAGTRTPDGWLSDGVYYINMRQVWCSSGPQGTCQKQIGGLGTTY
jgi:hypothetical protein